jgi:hypothetical protein
VQVCVHRQEEKREREKERGETIIYMWEKKW